MNNRAGMFAEAARGPILLITVGCLFALQQSGIMSFGKTWPALIIVFGILKLLERVVMGPQPRPAMPPHTQPPPYTPPQQGWNAGYPNAGAYQPPGSYRSAGTYNYPAGASNANTVTRPVGTPQQSTTPPAGASPEEGSRS